MRFFLASIVGIGIVIGIACGGSTSTTDGGSGNDGSIPPDFTSCNAPGECDIRPKSCCGSCGSPTPSDMLAVNWQKGGAYQSAMCAMTACPACAMEPNPNLAPFCRSKSCNAVDVRTDSVSACAIDTDCRLRFAGCCEYCTDPSASKLIAIATSGNAEYTANQCHPDQGGCPKCAVMYPPGYAARCNPMSKHCEVVMVNISDAGAD